MASCSTQSNKCTHRITVLNIRKLNVYFVSFKLHMLTLVVPLKNGARTTPEKSPIALCCVALRSVRVCKALC